MTSKSQWKYDDWMKIRRAHKYNLVHPSRAANSHNIKIRKFKMYFIFHEFVFVFFFFCCTFCAHFCSFVSSFYLCSIIIQWMERGMMHFALYILALARSFAYSFYDFPIIIIFIIVHTSYNWIQCMYALLLMHLFYVRNGK